MPLGPQFVSFDLQTLTCHDKGQDPGPRAEPYLWVIYFTVDGTTAQLSDPDFTLHGVARVVPTAGSHGDLGVVEVSSGQVVPIPQALGDFNTTLIPIPVSQQLQNLGAPAQVAGVAGAVCVLMEQDWTSDSAAEAGHQALNNAFRTQLNKLVDELGALHPQPTPADVDTISQKIQQAVKDAIVQSGGILEDIVNLLNSDDFIGAQQFIFTQTQLAATPTQTLSARFTSERNGDWEIKGAVKAHAVVQIPRPVPLPVGP